MILHNEVNLFERIVLDTSEKNGIAPAIIEKDYYVSLFLREIITRQPDIVFRGGTSLSKCYHLINRFSEDIDLGFGGAAKPTEGQRKHLCNVVGSIIKDYGFVLNNPNEIYSRRDFNRYEISVQSLFSFEYIKHDLIVETAMFLRSYPNITMTASSYIYDYLKDIEREDIIAQYELKPFALLVQSLERTFVDKIFAVCDYYLNGNIYEHSRHLYDLYKMADRVLFDENLKRLFADVREERKAHNNCLSAQDGVCITECLREIINGDIYKNDYESITLPFFFDRVEYETVKMKLQSILTKGFM